MQLPFTKMHGLGNDFVVVRGVGELPAATIQAMANRHTGIGFDQLLWLDDSQSDAADIFYRIFNADGGEVEQCGNGARAIARFIAGDSQDPARIWKLAFPGGIVDAVIQPDGNVAVSMGEPDFAPDSLPFEATGLACDSDSYHLDLSSGGVDFSVVSMGNPHAVIEVEDTAEASVGTLGPMLESHERFANRANIGFMHIVDPSRINLRVFERGVGETSACGTGACAAVAVGRRAGKLAEEVSVSLPGGELLVRWAGTGAPVWLIGEAVTAFQGNIDI